MSVIEKPRRGGLCLPELPSHEKNEYIEEITFLGMFLVSHELNEHLIYAYTNEGLLDYSFDFYYNKFYATAKRFQCILTTQQTHEVWCAIRNKC